MLLVILSRLLDCYCRHALTCRFCGNGVGKKSNHHAIPEFIGNKYLFSFYECKSCDTFFGSLENELSRQLNRTRTILGIEGKNGVPNCTLSRNEIIEWNESHKVAVYKKCEDGMMNTVRLDVLSNGGIKPNPICPYCYEKDKMPIFLLGVFNICLRCKTPFNDSMKRDFSLNFLSFDGVAAFKAFVKMALSIMPDKYIDKFKDTIKWIMETKEIEKPEGKLHSEFYENSRGLLVKQSSANGKKNNKVLVKLWK